MPGLNKVMIIGRLGRDPELKYTQDGTAVANFTVATSTNYKDKEKTEWHKVVAWKKLAEICGQYLVKGAQVYIEGSIQTRDWEDKEGNKRYTTEIVANQMQMLDGKKAQKQEDAGQPAAEPGGDDLPF